MAVFTVTTLNDVVNAGDGRLSLREAIGQANATTAADTIGFAAALDGGTVVLRGSQLTVTRDLTIDGDPNDDGSRVTIDADEQSRVMEVSGSGSDLTLSATVLTGGSTGDLYGSGQGMGINFTSNGRLKLTESDVSDNLGGLYGRGGGIFIAPDAALSTQNSIVSNNLSGDGGGIFASVGSSVSIDRSTIANNTGGTFYYGRGGGIFLEQCAATITNSAITDNGAYDAGGLWGSSSFVSIVNSTVAGNGASGGRVYPGAGGGIGADGQSTIALSQSTVTDNRAFAASYGGFAGGISAANVSINDSIVAGNFSESSEYFGRFEPSDIDGVSSSNGHNIFGTSVSGAVAGDRENVDPSLIFASIDPDTGGGRLALNGGPTPTVALRDNVTNPALSGADPFDAGATDQRGAARPQPGLSNPDIGAFELGQRSLSTSPSVNNDVLGGTSAANALAARDGNDLVLGNGGNDSLEGGPGSDTLRGGDGNDGLAGGFGNDGLDGGVGQDRALYRLDTERGFGLTIDLTAGTATSGSERDRLVSVEEVGGSIRDDTIIGSAAANAFLNGAEGRDFVFGRGGNDTVFGGPDDDQVLGEAGNDVLLGNAGADRLTGGAGRDRFDFDEGETGVGTGGRDLVLDFVRGSDRLDLAGIDADDDRSGNQTFAFTGTRAFSGVDGQLRYTGTTTRTVVQGDVDGDRAADVEIELAGRLSLAASDFIL